jgi:hypothetical protein
VEGRTASAVKSGNIVVQEVTFIELGSEGGVEVERPDPVIRFVQPNVVAGQAGGKKEQAVAEGRSSLCSR